MRHETYLLGVLLTGDCRQKRRPKNGALPWGCMWLRPETSASTGFLFSSLLVFYKFPWENFSLFSPTPFEPLNDRVHVARWSIVGQGMPKLFKSWLDVISVSSLQDFNKNKNELKQKLTPLQYKVTQEKFTERFVFQQKRIFPSYVFVCWQICLRKWPIRIK